MGGSAPGPDPNVGLAALQTAQLGKDALDWTKNYYDTVVSPIQQQQAATAQQQADQAMSIAADQQQQGDETYQFYKDNYRPVEQQIAQQALDYNTADHAERAVAQSNADVNSAFNQVTQQERADMARRGIDMSSGQSLATDRATALGRAAALAAGASTARTNAENTGFARDVAAASIGRGLPAQASTDASTALNAGSSAVGAQSSALSGATQAGSLVSGGYGQSIGASQGAGALWSQSSQQAQAAGAQNAANNQATIGAGVGAAATIAAAFL